MSSYEVTDYRVFDGRRFKARTNGGGACVFVRSRLDAVADSKSGLVINVGVSGLVALAKETK
jgi:hypothetical protein